jgi:hypothetical protein
VIISAWMPSSYVCCALVIDVASFRAPVNSLVEVVRPIHPQEYRNQADSR